VEGVFRQNKISSVTFSNGVTSIGNSSFSRNYLTDITIPNSVISIEYYAFANNKITSITIGSDVNLHLKAFEYNFSQFYDNNGKQAGTYIYKNGSWSKNN